MEYVVGSVAALVSGNVTPSRPKHLKRALTPTKHQPSPNVTPKSELVDRSIFLSPTLQKKKAIAKKSPKRIFENQNFDVTEEDSNLVSPQADKVKKHLEIELDANTSVNSSLLSPESPKDIAEMKKSPKKLKVMNAAAHVYENTSPKNNKRKLNEELVTKNVESNDASPNKKKKQERKPFSQDAANANQQNGAHSPKKNKKQQQQETARPNQGKNIKPQNQVQNTQAKQKPGQQNKNKAEKSVEVLSPKKQNQVQNSQGKKKQKPAQQNNKNKPAQSTETQSPKKQNQVQKTQAKLNQKAVQQNNKNKPAEKSVEAQSPKKQNKKKNRKNKKNQNQSVPKPEPKVEAESEQSDEDDDDDNNSIDPNTSSNMGFDSEDDSDNEVESGSDDDDDDDDGENDESINPNTSSNIGSDSEDGSHDEVESGSDEDDDDEEDNDDDDDDEENDDTVNPNAITNKDSDSEHDSDDEIESENDEANKQALQPEESSDDEEEDVKDTKNKAKKPEKKGKGPKVELTEEQKTEALEEEIKRTVFVGNVPFSKKCKKEIKKIFNEYGTIETIRIRTVPVKDATVTPKLAVIKNELHPERSTVNVYVKFADEASVEKALKANNTVLNGNHLRVHRTGTTGAVHDPKLSVFVGNIPFALEDEGLRAKFEKCGAIESVRIIRDRKTHAGKGFGYVNFESKDGVELALAMSEEDLTIKNRILRVKRCTHTEKKNKDKLPKKFVGNFQSNNKVQGDDGKNNNGAYRRIEMKRKLEARADGPANKRANVNQLRDKKQKKEFVGMTAEKKKKRKFDKGQKKKKVLGEILAKK